MKIFTDYPWFNTTNRQEFVRITDQVHVFYAEFDDQRKKRVVVKVMGQPPAP